MSVSPDPDKAPVRRRRKKKEGRRDVISSDQARREQKAAIREFGDMDDPRKEFQRWPEILRDAQEKFIERSKMLGSSEEVKSEEAFYSMVNQIVTEKYPEIRQIELPRLTELLRSNLFGYGVLEEYMRIDNLEELYFNRFDQGFFIAGGRKYRISDTVFYSSEDMRAFLDRVATENGLELNLQKPILDAALADGSRINASIEPIAVDGADFIIRKHRDIPFTLESMIENGVLGPELADDLRIWVQSGLNVIVSGGTASGKTSFLNTIGKTFIPSSDRVLVLENRKELQLETEDCKYFQTREDPTVPGERDITLEVLVRATLRKRPQRIIIGEVRGPEAYYALEAWNTGHEGSLCTVHSNSAVEAIARLESLASRAGQIDSVGIRRLLAGAVDIVIQLQMDPASGKRVVREVLQVLHPFKCDPSVDMQELAESDNWQEIRDEISSLYLYRSFAPGQPAERVEKIVPIVGRGPRE